MWPEDYTRVKTANGLFSHDGPPFWLQLFVSCPLTSCFPRGEALPVLDRVCNATLVLLFSVWSVCGWAMFLMGGEGKRDLYSISLPPSSNSVIFEAKPMFQYLNWLCGLVDGSCLRNARTDTETWALLILFCPPACASFCSKVNALLFWSSNLVLF